jgi:hypothetical protein
VAPNFLWENAHIDLNIAARKSVFTRNLTPIWHIHTPYSSVLPGFYHPGAPIHLYGGQLQYFEPFCDIVGCLSEPAIDLVCFHLWEPGPFGIILQVADAKVLFNDIARFGDLLVAFDLSVRRFKSSGRPWQITDATS